MERCHLIAKQVFELRVGFNESQLHQLQASLSRQYWQSVVPAFERLFDRLVGPDEMVRVDRLELDLGRWSTEDILSGRFVESLVSRLESVISSGLRGTDFKADVQPVRSARFDLWLHFLEHGSLPLGVALPESQQKWYLQVIEHLGSESGARQRLRNLVSRNKVALERLILQHDKHFLQQLIEGVSNRRQNHLHRLVDDVVRLVVRDITDLSDRIRVAGETSATELESIADALLDLLSGILDVQPGSPRRVELKSRIVHALVRKAPSPMALARWLVQADSWRVLLSGLVQPEASSLVSKRIAQLLGESIDLQRFAAESKAGPTLPARDLLRRVELVFWRTLIEEVVIKRRISDTFTLIARVIRSDDLLPWRVLLLKKLGASGDMKHQDKAWRRIAEILVEVPPSALILQSNEDSPIEVAQRDILATEEAEKPPLSFVEEGGLYYVQSAGVILFHPFLQRFFQNLGLCNKSAFIDEVNRQRAVCLVHHLATGEVRTPEYQLVLPKFLCGMPLNGQIDHFIEIDEPEQTESENLIHAAIDHWSVLGKASPDWLREMFIQRDGKLEKRETGWHLLVERKAQDILLDRLPQGWGLGIVKLPWMDDVLRVDW